MFYNNFGFLCLAKQWLWKRTKSILMTGPRHIMEWKHCRSHKPDTISIISWKSFLKLSVAGFPGGAVVESLPANAGHTGSSPGLGGSHMPRSGWAREPQLLSLHVWSLCSATREAAIVRGPRTAMRSGPPFATTGESPRTETKTQHSQK